MLLDLAFIPMARKPFTNQEFEEVQTNSSQEEITSSPGKSNTNQILYSLKFCAYMSSHAIIVEAQSLGGGVWLYTSKHV